MLSVQPVVKGIALFLPVHLAVCLARITPITGSVNVEQWLQLLLPVLSAL